LRSETPELLLRVFLDHIRAGKFGESFVSGNVVALDRALSQLLVELCVGTVEFGESFVSGNVVALDRALSQLLLELRVGAGEFGECFVAETWTRLSSE